MQAGLCIGSSELIYAAGGSLGALCDTESDAAVIRASFWWLGANKPALGVHAMIVRGGGALEEFGAEPTSTQVGSI